ncbi:hypothetical protein KKA17_04860 [bacterium]|nr:hypothetical protein [bacterium]MBU1884273.1 hypothetical protein [bacterium]
MIEKQQLIKEPLDKDTLKLAQVIYSTFVANDDDPYMYIPLKRLYALFGLDDSSRSRERVLEMFLELMEPIKVQDFEFLGKKYPEKILEFCAFNEIEKDGELYMEIELNEMYLEAMKNYMTDPFLEVN